MKGVFKGRGEDGKAVYAEPEQTDPVVRPVQSSSSSMPRKFRRAMMAAARAKNGTRRKRINRWVDANVTHDMLRPR